MFSQHALRQLPLFIAECNERVARGEIEDNEYTRVVAADHPEAQARFIANVLQQMDQNRKTTCLKELQGKMWAEGYKQSQFKGQ
jgi:methionine salvage enolase-phosphatase E1